MILVTGGTGLVGSHLLYSLLKKGKTVRAIHRNTSDLRLVETVFSYYTDDYKNLFKKIEWVEADLINIPALTDAFNGITHVYHAAAYVSFNPDHFNKLTKSNIEGTANIVNLCIANKIEKLCYVSSVATLGSKPKDGLIDEETEWNPEAENSVYAITKFGAEMEVWRGSQEGLNVVIVNPGIIFGAFPTVAGSGVIIKMVQQKMPFYTSGSIGIVDVEDVVKALILLMESATTNQRFILVSQNITYKELLSKIAQNLHITKARRPIAKWKLIAFSKIDWFLNKIFRTKRMLLKNTVNSMYTTSNYDASKIENTLNFTFTDYEETIRKTVSAFQKK